MIAPAGTNNDYPKDGINPPSTFITTTTTTTSNNKKKRDISDACKSEIMNFLLMHYHNGKLKNNSIKLAALKFEVSRHTVGRIWKRIKPSLLQEDTTAIDVSPSRKKGNCGRPQKNWDAKIEKINSIPISERSSLRKLSLATEIPKTTLFRLMQEGRIERIGERKKTVAKCSRVEQRTRTSTEDSPKKKGSGRPQKNWDDKIEKINSIPMSERSSLRKLSLATEIPKTTLFRLMQEGRIKRIGERTKTGPNQKVELHYQAEETTCTTSTENYDNSIEIKNPSPDVRQVVETLEELDASQITIVKHFLIGKNWMKPNKTI